MKIKNIRRLHKLLHLQQTPSERVEKLDTLSQKCKHF